MAEDKGQSIWPDDLEIPDFQDKHVTVWSGAGTTYYALYPIPKVRVCVWREAGGGIEAQLMDNRHEGGRSQFARWTAIGYQRAKSSERMEDTCRAVAQSVYAGLETGGAG